MSDLRTVATKRLDAFVDAAFAFAVTMLVVSTGGAMDSYDGLLTTFAYVPAFALSLLIILSFWWAHRQFSLITLRSDKINDALSMLIMFVIIIYVFPVSFLTRALIHWLSDAALPGTGLLPFQIRSIYQIFGGGFALLSTIYAVMYRRASYLDNGPCVPMRFQPTATRASHIWALWAAAALLSILLALFGGLERLIWLPLLPYFFAMPLAIGWHLWRPIAPQAPITEDDLHELMH